MTTAHTPAPWDSDGATILYATPHEEDAVPMIEIRANVTEAGWDTVCCINATGPHAKSTARLIVALPEMLESLRTLRECCLEALNDDWDRSNDGFEAMLDDIDAVLAKATSN